MVKRITGLGLGIGPLWVLLQWEDKPGDTEACR